MSDRHNIDAEAMLRSAAPTAPRGVEWDLAVEELAAVLADDDQHNGDHGDSVPSPQAAARALFAAVRQAAVEVAVEHFGRAR